jgi:Glycosyl transferases group 1
MSDHSTSLRKIAGRFVREMQVHRRRLAHSARGLKKAVTFLSDSISGWSGELRSIALEPHLARFGWRLISVPPNLSLSQRRRIIGLDKPDLILLQQSRHPLNRPALYRDIPVVFDADDADILDSRCVDSVIECCRGSVSIIAGSRFLRDQFRIHNANVAVVWTSTYLEHVDGSIPANQRGPVVTWAHSGPLDYVEEAKFVRNVILKLARRAAFSFRLYGVAESRKQEVDDYLEPLRKIGLSVQTVAPMPYHAFVQSLGNVAVGLHPVCTATNPFSQGKSFGKLLAYLAADVAIVTSNAVDHPLFFKDNVNGMLLADDVDTWVERCERLINFPDLRQKIADAARADFRRRLTSVRAAELVAAQFDRALLLSNASVAVPAERNTALKT